MSQIAIRRQQFDETRVGVKCGLDGSIQLRPVVPTVHIITRDAMLKRIQSRRHRSQRRSAKRRRNIAPFEYETICGKLVQVWRLDMPMTHKTIVGPRLVVTQNENDIGPVRCLSLGGRLRRKHLANRYHCPNDGKHS